jgi:hypothetical protein
LIIASWRESSAGLSFLLFGLGVSDVFCSSMVWITIRLWLWPVQLLVWCYRSERLKCLGGTTMWKVDSTLTKRLDTRPRMNFVK